MPKEATSRPCELCNETAVIYCPSDSAYLCWNCDCAVHSANFLVARHHRSTLCTWCGDFHGEDFSGAGIRRYASSACKACGRTSPIEDDEVSSLSSVCISTNESSTGAVPATAKCSRDQDCCGEVSSVMRRTVVDAKLEGVLVNWCKRLGIEGNNQDDVVVATAAEALGRLMSVPVRVALAAAFWVGLRFRGDTCRDVKLVEKVTGVPARMILALEAKLQRVLKTRRKIASHHDDSDSDSTKEGWAEC